MSSNTMDPPSNGAILNIAQLIKAVISTAAKAKLGALYINKELVQQITRNVKSKG